MKKKYIVSIIAIVSMLYSCIIIMAAIPIDVYLHPILMWASFLLAPVAIVMTIIAACMWSEGATVRRLGLAGLVDIVLSLAILVASQAVEEHLVGYDKPWHIRGSITGAFVGFSLLLAISGLTLFVVLLVRRIKGRNKA